MWTVLVPKNFVLPIKDFLKNQNESALDVLGFLPYRPVIPAVVTELTEDGYGDSSRDEKWAIVLLRLMASL